MRTIVDLTKEKEIPPHTQEQGTQRVTHTPTFEIVVLQPKAHQQLH